MCWPPAKVGSHYNMGHSCSTQTWLTWGRLTLTSWHEKRNRPAQLSLPGVCGFVCMCACVRVNGGSIRSRQPCRRSQCFFCIFLFVGCCALRTGSGFQGAFGKRSADNSYYQLRWLRQIYPEYLRNHPHLSADLTLGLIHLSYVCIVAVTVRLSKRYRESSRIIPHSLPWVKAISIGQTMRCKLNRFRNPFGPVSVGM